MDAPLVDLGSLMLVAGQRTSVLPNMGLVLRFPGCVTPDELAAEARRLASSPYGLGRRLTSPRVPGARPRWRPAPDPPDVVLGPEASDARAVASWLANEMSVRHDPQHGAGWRLAAVYGPSRETFVALTMNHLFGTGRDVMAALYGGDAVARVETNGAGPSGLSAEIADAADRVRRGVIGLARLGGDLVTAPLRRAPHSDLATLVRPVAALRDRDPSRGRASARRVAAVARVDGAAWDAAAAERGGTRMALLAAVVANLIREARLSRGGSATRPVRMIVPVDVADRSAAPTEAATVGPIELTSATLVLPGGPPSHPTDLGDVRDATRRAFAAAKAEVAASGRIPVAPGVVDAMRLLPDRLAAQVLFGVHGHFDGAASSVGTLPPTLLRLGPHVATDAFLMAFPLGSDLGVALAGHGDTLSIGVVADPSRLGHGPALRDRVTRELHSWGLTGEVW